MGVKHNRVFSLQNKQTQNTYLIWLLETRREKIFASVPIGDEQKTWPKAATALFSCGGGRHSLRITCSVALILV